MKEQTKSNLIAYKLPRKAETEDQKVMPFTTVPNHIIYDHTLSCKAKAVYMYIESVSSIPGWTLNILAISKSFKESKDTISSAINELIEAGYLKRERVTDNNNRFSNFVYKFTEVKKKFETFFSPAKKPYPENPDTENQDQEFTPPNKTNINKTNINKKQQTKAKKSEPKKEPYKPASLPASKKESAVAFSKDNLSKERKELLEKLISLEVSETFANELILNENISNDLITNQINYLPYRKAKQPGKVLYMSIKNNWDMPKDYEAVKVEKEKAEQVDIKKELLAKYQKAFDLFNCKMATWQNSVEMFAKNALDSYNLINFNILEKAEEETAKYIQIAEKEPDNFALVLWKKQNGISNQEQSEWFDFAFNTLQKKQEKFIEKLEKLKAFVSLNDLKLLLSEALKLDPRIKNKVSNFLTFAEGV